MPGQLSGQRMEQRFGYGCLWKNWKFETPDTGFTARTGEPGRMGDVVSHPALYENYPAMKDMRASSFEPMNVLSSFKWQGGLGYYESTADAATNFFFSWLPKGTFVFEYPLRVTYNGDFSNGITTVQSMYAPEFTSHSAGIRVKVD